MELKAPCPQKPPDLNTLFVTLASIDGVLTPHQLFIVVVVASPAPPAFILHLSCS